MVGFTSGAAVVILLSQLPRSLGIDVGDVHATVDVAWFIANSIGEADLRSSIIGMVSFSAAVLFMVFAPRLPNYLLALIVGTLLSFYLSQSGSGIEYVQSVSIAVPPIQLPQNIMGNLPTLASSALALALVGLLEATAISRSLAQKSDEEINVSQEFFGQGMSNIIGSFFSTYMGSGSFTRSAANYDAGAKSPLTAVYSSILLLVILILFGPWIEYIPIAAISGVILLVAIKLISFREIAKRFTTSRSSSVVMIVTFVSTIVVGLELSIIIGVIVSLGSYLRRSSTVYLALTAPDPTTERHSFRNSKAFDLAECPQLACARLDGQLYFGSIEDVRRQLRLLERERPEQKHLLLLMKNVADLDMAGADLLVDEARRRKTRGGQLYLTIRQHQLSDKFSRFGVVDAVGLENVFQNKGEAIVHIVSELNKSTCSRCEKRIFNECPPRAQ